VTVRLRDGEELAANVSAFVAAILLGASVVAIRVAVRDIEPTTLAVFRFGQGAIVLLVAIGVTRPALLHVTTRSLRAAALLGAIFFSLFPLSFNAGLQFTQATRGALMLATMPIWSMLLARWLIGERLGIRRAVGVGLTMCGVLIVVSERGLNLEADGRALLGDALVLLTAFLGALYGVLAKRVLEREHPLTVVTYAMLFGTLFLVPIALWEGLAEEIQQLDSSLALIVLYLGVPGGAIAFAMWTAALARLSPTQVAVYVNLNPVVAAILGVILLSERATPIYLASFAAVIGGVLLVNLPAKNGRRWLSSRESNRASH
jgi:drug/metabolite transporter (DMT)-like permease